MKKLILTLSALLLICFFCQKKLIAQDGIYDPELHISNDKNGYVKFSSTGTSEDDMHFYIFGSGYYSGTNAPVHQFNESNYQDSTTAYFVKPYKPTKPPKRRVAPPGTPPKWYGDKTNSKVPLSGDIDVKESWSPAAHTDNEHLYMLVFENKNDEMADGCVEFHYNSSQVSIAPTDILIYHDWVYNQTVGISTETGCDTKISWDFDTLKYGVQRVVYIPTEVLVAAGSTITRIGKYFDACTGAGSSSSSTTSDVQLYPHDPNFKRADKLCIVPNAGVQQSIEYMIQFHNDGEYYAQDVFVSDVIPLELDLGSFVFLNSKTPCTFNIDYGTRRINFLFDDIFLPGLDQVTDGMTYSYEETVGWLKFRICTLPNIPPNHCIVNVGEIIFDTQPLFYTPPSRVCAQQNEDCGMVTCF